MKRLTIILITATAAAALAASAPAYVIDPSAGFDAPLVLKVKTSAKAKQAKKSARPGISVPARKPVLQIEP